MKKRTWLRKLIYLLLIIALVALIIVFLQQNSAKNTETQKETETITQTEKAKIAEVIPFTQWQPNNYRKVLGTVKSSTDTDVHSNLSGKIAKVFVDIGDKVYQGEVLAKFSRENDISQISYENALNSLENAKNSAENSIRSAEIALENAKNDLNQVITSTEQNNSQVFNLLYSQAKNSETGIYNVLNWADRLFGVSRNVKYELSPYASKVGQNNSILKNSTKNYLQEILRKIESFRDLESYEKNDESKVLAFAVEKNNVLKETQEIIRNIDQLIRETSTSSSFPMAVRSQLTQEVEIMTAKIDGAIVGLESQIEAAKSSGEQINTAVLSAENRVKNAEANLELSRSSADNQISGVRNQINLASKSIKDLEVKAPFAGKISAKFISDFNQVNPGQKLFSIVALDSVPEIIAYLSAEETRLLANPENIKLSLPNGETTEVIDASASGKLDETSQKMEVKFRGNYDDLLVGSIVNVLLPVNSEESNLIPISAISFEPDGAEVFVVNSAKKVERKKVQTGKIVSNAVEILGGLNAGEQVIQYRNRVNAGDLVEVKN